jgi:hypothetical protein
MDIIQGSSDIAAAQSCNRDFTFSSRGLSEFEFFNFSQKNKKAILGWGEDDGQKKNLR